MFPANTTSSASATYSGVSAQVDFGPFDLAAGLNRLDPAGPDTATSGSRNSWWLSAMFKLPAGELRLNAGRLATDLASGTDPKATLLAASYNYPLSRSTNLYGSYGHMNNNESARFALEASSRTVALSVAAGADTTGLVRLRCPSRQVQTPPVSCWACATTSERLTPQADIAAAALARFGTAAYGASPSMACCTVR